jgi:hypothetical protein
MFSLFLAVLPLYAQDSDEKADTGYTEKEIGEQTENEEIDTLNRDETVREQTETENSPPPIENENSGWKLFFGIGSYGGTLGISQSFNEKLGMQTGISFFTFQRRSNVSHAEKEFDTEFSLLFFNLPLTLDFYPTEMLKISAGIYANINTVTFVIHPAETRSYGDIELSPEEQGALSTSVSFWKIAPYLGFGIINIPPGFPLQAAIDAGVMYQGYPKVSRSATGMLSPSTGNTEGFENRLKQHSYLRLYPVINLYLTLRRRPPKDNSW